MNLISVNTGSPDFGAPLLRLQLIVNPALAGGSLTGAFFNLAAVAALAGVRHLLARFARTSHREGAHG